MGSPFKSPETKRLNIDWLHAAVALVKECNLHEGIWQVGIEFDLRGAVVKVDAQTSVPAAFIPALRLVLTRVETMDALTVDAALVNPRKRLIVPV